MVRTDSEKTIDFASTSPFGGGRPGRTKRKSVKRGNKKIEEGEVKKDKEETKKEEKSKAK